MKLFRPELACWLFLLLSATTGCSLFPEARQRDRVHNPFPQLQRVAVLPFFNQSSEPTVDTELVAENYRFQAAADAAIARTRAAGGRVVDVRTDETARRKRRSLFYTVTV